MSKKEPLLNDKLKKVKDKELANIKNLTECHENSVHLLTEKQLDRRNADLKVIKKKVEKWNKDNPEAGKIKCIKFGIVQEMQIYYTETLVMSFLDSLVTRLLTKPDALFIAEYYMDPNNTDRSIPYTKLVYATNKYVTSKQIYAWIKEVIEIKLVKGALTGKYKENFTKFLLISKYGYSDADKDKDKDPNQPIVFKFGDPSLDKEKEE